MKRIILFMIVSFILTGCTQNLFNFTLVSTKSVELEKLSSLKKSSEKAIGEDKASLIIFIPTRTIKVDQAITNTIDAIPGCVALMDGVVYSKFWWIPYIYGEQKFVIEATPLIDPTFTQTSTNLPNYGKVFITKEGNVDSIESISEANYLAEKKKIVQNSSKENKSYTQHK
ncbi:MAG: hypothetical protein RIC95_07100 [Vicingaceae bacterium]